MTGHHRDMLRSNSGSGECSKSVPLRRKKSVPTGRGDTRYGATYEVDKLYFHWEAW